MKQRSFFAIRVWTVLFVLTISILVEIVPIFLEARYEKLNRIIYAIFAIYLTLLVENYFNHRKFKLGVMNFIYQLKSVRINYELKSDAIQAIMKATTSQIAGVLDQSGKLEKEFTTSITNKKEERHCNICNTTHKTNSEAKCKNCKLDLIYWEKIVKS